VLLLLPTKSFHGFPHRLCVGRGIVSCGRHNGGPELQGEKKKDQNSKIARDKRETRVTLKQSKADYT